MIVYETLGAFMEAEMHSAIINVAGGLPRLGRTSVRHRSAHPSPRTGRRKRAKAGGIDGSISRSIRKINNKNIYLNSQKGSLLRYQPSPISQSVSLSLRA
jgi:hypothetical protein